MPDMVVRGIRLHYESAGRGEPLLLIHGLGSSTRDWESQVAAFSRDFRVITFDLRGHGRSDKPRGPYSIGLLAEDTLALLQALDISAHLVGLSLGGMVAFQVAVDAPERVRSLTIVNSGPRGPEPTFKQRLPLYIRLFIIRLLGMRRMGEALARRLFPKPEQAGLRRTFGERFAANDREAYIAALKAIFGGWSVAGRLGDIQCPTLALASDQDYTSVDLKRAYVAALPRAELVVVPDARHALPLEKPQEFNQALAAFLRQVGGEANP